LGRSAEVGEIEEIGDDDDAGVALAKALDHTE